MAVTPVNPLSLLPNSVDMSSLSHSELISLSLLSSPALASVDTALHQINRICSFNESESCRRQTYSATPHRHRHGVGIVGGEITQPERSESVKIVNHMKRYLHHQPRNVTVEIVNRNGAVVDLAALEESEERERGGPFAAELRRRFGGREKEEENLEVLAEMEGNWCSNRKKRRLIDASLLGDALPIGWQVIVALRRKGGRFSPFCRSYISPTGEHLSSCKEVSSYLKSYFGINDINLLRDSRGDLLQLQCVNSEDISMMEVSYASTSNTCLHIDHEKDVSVSGIDNLPDVQVCGIYECHTCNIKFDVKDKYLQHMMSTHERTTKSFRLCSSVRDQLTVKDGNCECEDCNIHFDEQPKYSEHLLAIHERKIKRRQVRSSVTDGVIIKDGKYGCQFCDKVFEGWRRYIGHVGNHVKGSIKSTKGLVPQPAKKRSADHFTTKIDNSKMNALVEIAQNPIQDISVTVPENKPSCVANIGRLCMAINGITEHGVEKCGNAGNALSPMLNPCTKVSGKSNACSRKPGKGERKDRTQVKKTLPLLNSFSEILTKDGGTNDSLSCLNNNEPKKDNAEAKANTSAKTLFLCDKMREKTESNGTTNDLASLLIDLDVENDGSGAKTSSNLKEHAFTRNVVDLELNSCFDDTMTPEGETSIQADNSAGNWVVKSTITENGRSVEGGFEISFLSLSEKPCNMDSSVEKMESMYKDNYEPECVQMHDASDLATVTGDALGFGCSMSQTLLNPSSPFDEIFEKAGQSICSLDPNFENENGFEYMKLDEIEPQMYKYNAMNGEDPVFLPDVSMDLEKDTGFDLGFTTNPRSEFSKEIASGKTTTMICVWCGLEFFNEVVATELQPDSVGFMCPACRIKISKQFNELESNFSVDPRY